jgi:hypothetical protein
MMVLSTKNIYLSFEDTLPLGTCNQTDYIIILFSKAFCGTERKKKRRGEEEKRRRRRGKKN